jgi:membrane protein DedA with SNARE-associated domain
MEQAREFLTQFSGPQGYLAFFALIMSCGMGAPFNSDFCLITASVLAAMGYFNLKILMVLAFFALLTGDSFVFFIGRNFGKALLLRRPFRWIFKPEKVVIAERFIHTRGEKFMFVVRFLPLIRTVLFFTAGSLQVRPKMFYLGNAVATAIYLPALMISAYLASENIDAVVSTLKKFQFGLLAVVALAFAYFLNQKRLRKNREKGTLPA